jgi:hypothetical protein
MAETKLSDIIESFTSVFLNLLYTLLLAAPVSYFLQKLMTYFTLPWLYETREINREYEDEFAHKTNNNDYLLRNPCTIRPHIARCH